MTAQYVYFLRPVGAEGPVKIGCSILPIERLKQLATWSPIDLEIVTTVPGDFDLERKLHGCFADQHSHREWFNAHPRLTDFIRAIQSGVPVEQAIDLNDRRGSIKAKAAAKREPWSEGRREKMRWMVQCHAALKRAKKWRQEPLWMPARVWDLLYSELGDAPGQRLPTQADINIMSDYCAYPEKQSQTYQQRFPDGPGFTRQAA